MTLVQATSSLRAITFDGATVTVLSRRGKVLRQFPVEQLVDVKLKPVGFGGSGSLQFYVTGPASSRDHTLFRNVEQPAFEQLHDALCAAIALRPTPDRVPRSTGTPIVVMRESATARWTDRLALLTFGLSIVPLLALALAVVAVVVFCTWGLIVK